MLSQLPVGKLLFNFLSWKNQMPAHFFARLMGYYGEVAAILRGESSAASIFANAVDIGASREHIYRRFLKEHLPSACNVLLGGFLFNQQGEESGQIDLIVTAQDCPQFNLTNSDGNEKAFACIDGTLAVASVKSRLDSKELRIALTNLGSIPRHKTNLDWPSLGIENPHYEYWPYKIIFASDGISEGAIMDGLREFYTANEGIPLLCRPDIIHVAGKYCIRRSLQNLEHEGATISAGTYFSTNVEADVVAITMVVHNIQQMLAASRFIPFDYSELFINMLHPDADDV